MHFHPLPPTPFSTAAHIFIHDFILQQMIFIGIVNARDSRRQAGKPIALYTFSYIDFPIKFLDVLIFIMIIIIFRLYSHLNAVHYRFTTVYWSQMTAKRNMR